MPRASLRPSRLLGAVLVLTHAAAVAILFPLQITPEWKGPLLAAIAASLAHALRRCALLRSGDAIVEIEVSDRERASICTRSGDWHPARILGTSCVTPALTAINLRVEGLRMPRHVLLVRDNVDAEDFRKVRVLLRWARAHDDEPEQAAD
jgi:toxin CptA